MEKNTIMGEKRVSINKKAVDFWSGFAVFLIGMANRVSCSPFPSTLVGAYIHAVLVVPCWDT